MDRVALSWSGGKDSALALWALRAQGVEPCALMTTVAAPYDRVSIHGMRSALLRRQAAATGIPLVEVRLPSPCPNEVYARRIGAALVAPPLADVDTVAFGDLFLADIRAYREERMAEAGRRATFPLWGRQTSALARDFLAAGFEALVVCVDPQRLDPRLAGRPYDAHLLAELPPEVDPCGENGEFHTLVHAGPVFSAPIAVTVGATVTRDGFVYCDVAQASTK